MSLMYLIKNNTMVVDCGPLAQSADGPTLLLIEPAGRQYVTISN